MSKSYLAMGHPFPSMQARRPTLASPPEAAQPATRCAKTPPPRPPLVGGAVGGPPRQIKAPARRVAGAALRDAAPFLERGPNIPPALLDRFLVDGRADDGAGPDARPPLHRLHRL